MIELPEPGEWNEFNKKGREAQQNTVRAIGEFYFSVTSFSIL
jgi:hypothetical protein